MFTRQKKNYRTFVYVALVIALCILVVALVWPKPAEPVNNETVNTEKELQSDNNHSYVKDYEDKDDKSYIEDEQKEKDKISEEEKEDKPVVGEEQSSYYVVKKKGDKISVFFCNEKGEEIELETTDIVYDLLTPEDQKNFEEGIKADSQEQLSSILQDFES